MIRMVSRLIKQFKKKTYKKLVRKVKKGTFNTLLVAHAFRFWIASLIVVFMCVIGGVYAYNGVHTRIVDVHTISDTVILSRIGKLITLPESPLLSLKRVEDAESLRSQNEFYHPVQEGNYIAVYDTMLIIYDVVNDRIVAVKTKGGK